MTESPQEEQRGAPGPPSLAPLLRFANATSAVLVVYVLGFLVAQQYLASQNIAQLGFLRLHYAAAGVLFLFLAGFLFVIGWFAAEDAQLVATGPFKQSRRVIIPAHLAFVLAVSAAVWPMLIRLLSVSFSQQTWWFFTFGIATGLLYHGTVRELWRRQQNEGVWGGVMFDVFARAFMVVSLVGVVSQSVYRNVRPSFGGGAGCSIRMTQLPSSSTLSRLDMRDAMLILPPEDRVSLICARSQHGLNRVFTLDPYQRTWFHLDTRAGDRWLV